MFFDKDICKERLFLYLEAEAAVLRSQAYSIGGRTLTRANLSEIRDGIRTWNERLKAAVNGSGGVVCRRVIPHG